jgi:hypothetical protein
MEKYTVNESSGLSDEILEVNKVKSNKDNKKKFIKTQPIHPRALAKIEELTRRGFIKPTNK